MIAVTGLEIKALQDMKDMTKVSHGATNTITTTTSDAVVEAGKMMIPYGAGGIEMVEVEVLAIERKRSKQTFFCMVFFR